MSFSCYVLCCCLLFAVCYDSLSVVCCVLRFVVRCLLVAVACFRLVLVVVCRSLFNVSLLSCCYVWFCLL